MKSMFLTRTIKCMCCVSLIHPQNTFIKLVIALCQPFILYLLVHCQWWCLLMQHATDVRSHKTVVKVLLTFSDTTESEKLAPTQTFCSW